MSTGTPHGATAKQAIKNLQREQLLESVKNDDLDPKIDSYDFHTIPETFLSLFYDKRDPESGQTPSEEMHEAFPGLSPAQELYFAYLLHLGQRNEALTDKQKSQYEAIEKKLDQKEKEEDEKREAELLKSKKQIEIKETALRAVERQYPEGHFFRKLFENLQPSDFKEQSKAKEKADCSSIFNCFGELPETAEPIFLKRKSLLNPIMRPFQSYLRNCQGVQIDPYPPRGKAGIIMEKETSGLPRQFAFSKLPELTLSVRNPPARMAGFGIGAFPQCTSVFKDAACVRRRDCQLSDLKSEADFKNQVNACDYNVSYPKEDDLDEWYTSREHNYSSVDLPQKGIRLIATPDPYREGKKQRFWVFGFKDSDDQKQTMNLLSAKKWEKMDPATP